jgi:hypothetical protein
MRLPERTWAPQREAPKATLSGVVGCVEIGSTKVRKVFGGRPFWGTVTRFHHPFYLVEYDDGDRAEYTGKELAPILRLTVNEICDPRRWHYGWATLNMANVPGFTAHMAEYMDEQGMILPIAWTGHTADAEAHAAAGPDTAGNADDFLRAEEAELQQFHLGLLSSARAARTLRNYRLAALKLVWFALTRKWTWPLSAARFGWYLSKLYKDQDNIGAPVTTNNAMALLCSMNGVDGAPYKSLSATAAIQAARRDHKHVVQKSAALSAAMVRAINRRYSFPRQGRPRRRQWEFGFGTAVSVAFKILLRYDDLKRCLYDDDFCEVFQEYVRFYVEGRKNDAMGCAFLDIARPANGDPDGVYFIVVRAKKYFRTGHVLPHIDRRTGEVDHTRPMSIGDFVAFLRSALVTIGLSKEEAALFAGQSARAGGATEAAAKGLHQEDIQHLAGVTSAEWLSWYNRRFLPERLRVSRALGL